MNAGNKNTPNMYHPRRRNVTTSMVGLKKNKQTKQTNKQTKNKNKNGQIRKNLTQNGEPQKHSSGTQKKKELCSSLHTSNIVMRAASWAQWFRLLPQERQTWVRFPLLARIFFLVESYQSLQDWYSIFVEGACSTYFCCEHSLSRTRMS